MIRKTVKNEKKELTKKQKKMVLKYEETTNLKFKFFGYFINKIFLLM